MAAMGWPGELRQKAKDTCKFPKVWMVGMEGCTEEYALHRHQPALNKEQKPLQHRLGRK